MTAKPIREIDHLLTHVRDLDAAASSFRRMGFTLSPVSRIEPMGIANHLALMRPRTPGFANYIELMAAHDRTLLPPPMAKVLSGAEGIKSMVLGTEDATAAQLAMLAAGFAAAPPVHVKREWKIGPSQSIFPEFDVLLPVEAPLAFNACRYFNVDLYLRPEWLEHANGARHVLAVLAVAGQAEAVIRRYAALFGMQATEANGVWRVAPGHLVLEVMSPAVVRRRFGLAVEAPREEATYLGYLVQVDSLAGVRACLAKGAVAHRDAGETICVDPADGLGNLIAFTE